MTAVIDDVSLDALKRAIPREVTKIARVLDEAGHRTWVVGGSLRDQLKAGLDASSSQQVADWDLATDARPETVQRLFKKVIPTGIKHGTVTVLIRGQGYEVTTLRGEVGYSDGRRPDSVYFVDEIREDLARRDFTINAIAYDPLRDNLEDPFDGLEDLRNHTIRAVGDARERFDEDGLRVLRAARFVATLEFELAPETAQAIRPSLGSFKKVSPERVRDEWMKVMRSKRPSRAFSTMLDHGLLEVTAPDLQRLAHDNRAAFEVALRAVDACPAAEVLRLAALLHNVAHIQPGPESTLERHQLLAEQSAQISHALLQQLKCSNRERDTVVCLVRYHTLMRAQTPSDAILRRWLRQVDLERAPDMVLLMSAIAQAEADAELLARVQLLGERTLKLAATAPPLSIGQLAIGGADLKRELGIAPGPAMGKILAHLLELVLDSPNLNQPDTLLEAAKRWLAESS